jgi:hypothetical protein
MYNIFHHDSRNILTRQISRVEGGFKRPKFMALAFVCSVGKVFIREQK